ncbi:MAG: ferrochelatase [Sandaracinus sp.]|nr:ferrochelatase [Sandaracinus sp.]
MHSTPARSEGLADLDALIDRGQRLTLAPDRDRPTSLVELSRLAPEPFRPTFAAVLERVARAQVRAFPGNLFWDMDSLAASLLRQALTDDEPAARLDALADSVARLQSLFGGETTIHFRYVHDFVYGYDWAKWVKREVPARRYVGPFDAPFLAYSERRAGELIELIEADDAKYGQLPSDQARNPFGFSREPDDEIRLFRDLAARDLLPLRAWETDPALDWEPPYQDLREERAHALGLGLP